MDELLCIKEELRTKIPDGYRVFLWLLLTIFWAMSLSSMSPRSFDLACGLTLGLLVAIAGALGMSKQPLDDVPLIATDCH